MKATDPNILMSVLMEEANPQKAQLACRQVSRKWSEVDKKGPCHCEFIKAEEG